MNDPIHDPATGQPSQSNRAPLRKRRGVALILVIAFIVLLSALVIGFFSRVTTELAGAATYAEGISARQLADTSVSVVEGQIRSATTVKNGAWASQPGMIRVFRDPSTGNAGKAADQFFKLYSSHDMIVANTSSSGGVNEFANFDPTSTLPAGGPATEVPLGAGGWTEQPAHFVDLNEPISIVNPTNVATTSLRYPIFDPSVARIAALGQNVNISTPWDAPSVVEGAEVTLPVGVDLTRNNAPMPVRWLYVLKDGTLTSSPLPGAASGTGTSATGLKMTWGATGPGGTATGVPTWDNPIVGRIAFWADDDTCKVNINTAAGYVLPSHVNEWDDTKLNYLRADTYPTAQTSGTYAALGTVEGTTGNAAFVAGTFWDTPRIQTYFDRGKNGMYTPNLGIMAIQAEILAGTLLTPTGYNNVLYAGGLSTSQPCANEFQRYPGHVSQTSLSLVYRNLLGARIDNFDPSGKNPSEMLYVMTPRILNGGSKSGTNQLDHHSEGPMGIKTTYFNGSDPAPITLPTTTTSPLITIQLKVPSITGLVPGMAATGTGIPPNTTLSAILSPNPPPAGFTPPFTISLSQPPTSANPTITFTTNSFHLYGSVDELAFSSKNLPVDATLRRSLADPVLGLTATTITPSLADKTRFFVTAHNRAPELTLFGGPRVAIWPEPTWKSQSNLYSVAPAISPSANPGDLYYNFMANPTDDLIRFCSTVGANLNETFNYTGGSYQDPLQPRGTLTPDVNHVNRPGQFIFDRQDPYSPSADFLMVRNQAIMAYLADATTGLTYRNTPGWGVSLGAKYAGGAAGIEGILTEIYDYIRCANLKDTSRDKQIYKLWSADGTGNLYKTDLVTGVAGPPNQRNGTNNTSLKQLQTRYAPRGIVVPTTSTFNGKSVKGFGRFPTITAVNLVFYHGGYLFKPNPGQVNAGIEDVTYDLDKVDNKRTTTATPSVAALGTSPGITYTGDYGTNWRNKNAITGQLVRSFLILEMYNPMQGYAPISNFNMSFTRPNRGVFGTPTPGERIYFTITGMSCQTIATDWCIRTPTRHTQWAPLGASGGTVPNPGQNLFNAMNPATLYTWQSSGGLWWGRNFGGIEGFMHLMVGKHSIVKDSAVPILCPQDMVYYPFQSPCYWKDDGVRVPWDVVQLTGCTITAGSNQFSYTSIVQLNAATAYGAASSAAPYVGMVVSGGASTGVGTAYFNNPAGGLVVTAVDTVTKRVTVNATATGSATSTNVVMNTYTTDTAFSFSGGTLDLDIGYLDATHTGASQRIQTFHLKFPASTVATRSLNTTNGLVTSAAGWPLPITERETANANSTLITNLTNPTLVGHTSPFPPLPRRSGWWQDPGGFDRSAYPANGIWGPTAPGNTSGTSVNESFNFFLTGIPNVWPATTAWNTPSYSTNGYATAASVANPMGCVATGFLTPAQINARFNSRYPGTGMNHMVAQIANYPNCSASGWAMPYHLGARFAWGTRFNWSYWGIVDTWWATKPPYDAAPYGPPGGYPAYGRPTGGDGKNYSGRLRQILQPGDTIRSVVVGGTGAGMGSTDPRVIAIQDQVAEATLGPHPLYHRFTCKDNTTMRRRAENLRYGNGSFFLNPLDTVLEPGATAQDPSTGSLIPLGTGVHYRGSTGPYVPRNLAPSLNTVLYQNGGSPNYADFDTGMGNLPDGGFNNKPDEGNLARFWIDYPQAIPDPLNPGNFIPQPPVVHWVEPYFNTWVYDAPLDTYFSPNRQMPSAVTFGSLLAPQGSWDTAGWKTLLFCPNPANQNHPGLTGVAAGTVAPDHLLLDLFWMPVVEPYAISEPLSTDGKVNLNYNIMPFSYIKRSTALRAVLSGQRVTAIPQHWTNANKQLSYKGQDNPENVRYLIDRDETLKHFDYLFSQYSPGTPDKGIFKSASQICEMFLYPRGNVIKQATPRNINPPATPPYNIGMTIGPVTDPAGSTAAVKAWWALNLLTGDNVREKPYGDIYPRITTKSNTYTIHYRVQTLRQRPYPGPKTDPAAATWYATWDESRDQVLSELRGSTTVERYIDPQDTRFNKYSTGSTLNPNFINVDQDSLEPAYRFRIINNKRFQPW